MEGKGRLTYLLLFIVLLFIWQVGGGIIMLSWLAFFPEGGTVSSFIAVNIPHLVLFSAGIFAIRKLLNDSIRDTKHSPKSYIITAVISFSVIALFQLLHVNEMHPSGYGLTEWLSMVPFVLIITPLQTAAEELLFRYTIYKAVVRKGSRREVMTAALLSGFIFLLFHMVANTEFRENPSFWLYAYYFLFGFLAMTLTAFTKDITYPVIIHAVNNVFVLTVAGYTSSSLESAPLFITDGVPSPFISTITLTAVFSAVFIYFIGVKHAKEEKTE